MDFDFNLILVPVTLLFFGIWLLDKLVFKQRKTRGKGKENYLISWAYDFWPILAIVLVVRSFFFEPYNIPSESMVPSLETGDFILVNKFAFGMRLPLLHTKVLSTGEPKHGDVAVFRYPANPNIYFIKRIIGLPGDTVRFDNDQLTINGEAVAMQPTQFNRDEKYVGQLDAKGQKLLPLFQEKKLAQRKLEEAQAVYHQETLGEHRYHTRQFDNIAPNGSFIASQSNEFIPSQGTQWQVTVPEGMYFAMGDNRDSSQDSRFWGFVPEKNLSGKATYVWMHKAPGWHLPSFSNARKID